MNGTQHTPAAAFQEYQEAVDWITGLMNMGIKPGLKRMQALSERFGNPERRMKFIHVAGTNGKGSTCAYLSRVLKQAGYDVGSFNSPYIERFTDRIRYNGEDIPDSEVLRLSNLLHPVCGEIAQTELGAPTMFEVCTMMALLYFGKVTYPDYVVWETGLGGEFDSTNIVVPVVSVITNIGHDHMDVLGGTLSDVARAKAGIIKNGVPVVTAARDPEGLEVILQTAEACKSTVYLLGRDFRYEQTAGEQDHQVLNFTGPFRTIPDVAISLNGPHQLENASLALMTLEVLRQYYALLCEDEELLAAMKETSWAGRLEMVSREPRILIDGAHNPEGAEVLAAALKSTYRYKRLHFMMGMLSTKNHEGYLRHILPLVDSLLITEPVWRKKQDAAELAKQVETLLAELPDKKVEVRVEPDWHKALQILQDLAQDPDDLAVVSGTLYLVSDVRSRLLFGTDSEKGW
ncbi:bifunctional folylpolyglutamate synthase/dihydrofolate synthase [Paenibacillus sp. y28]|uniref:bifunctional folylpolyglutamate synthase/dihydrofolate synthase n=1 Tax=Paenibacillus sp. y28 TaxID=3129110 RepID=UPI00301935E7